MKQEWKPDEMRASAEEIRGAIMPKSVTPEMVGGTLLGLVNAVGEVVEVLGEIPREHVRVRVRGYDGEGEVSAAGATVWLDIFSTRGFPALRKPRQELIADENGVVEFDVPHGFKYAIFSQVAGLGASFQYVRAAMSESADVTLWNLPIGVYILNYVVFGRSIEDEDIFEVYPFVSDHLVDDWAEYFEVWPCDEEAGEWSEDAGVCGIVVSTADTSFLIGENSKSEDSMVWCSNRDYAKQVPGLPMINNKSADISWEDAQNLARADMDGNLNTAIILDYCHNPVAANFCANSAAYWCEQRFLPSAGQLSLMQLNRKAINAYMQLLIDDWGWNYELLPDLKPGSISSWTSYEYWWSSTIFDELCSWVVDCDGGIIGNYSYSPYDVRAVSAFHFEY